MSRSWNGSSLVTEFSTLLGDTSAAFKSKVNDWINDVISEIANVHDWPYHKTLGRKKFTSGQELQALEISAPGAPSVAASTGGSLTADTAYYVQITFGQDNGAETVAGTASASVTPTGSDLTISASSIPVSTESLVTKRYVYLKKGSGDYYRYSTIGDNSTTTTTITADTSSTIEPPDHPTIRKVEGSPWMESPNFVLQQRDEDQLRITAGGGFTSGQPEYYAQKGESSFVIYPKPNSAYEVFFNYYRQPNRLYNSSDSTPDLPFVLKPVLKAGVIALGYEYREREGADIKRARYEQMLDNAGSNYSNLAEVSYSVTDVIGNADGFVVN